MGKFMNRKRGSLYLHDEVAVQEARSEEYRKGWDDRRTFDEGVVHDALRDGRNYRKFAENMRQKLSETGEKIE